MKARKVDKFKINRFGVLVTNSSSVNQCKEVNHTHYEYHVAAICDNKLDSDGFVINHTEIDRVVQEAFHRGMSSCEALLRRIVDAVQELMQQSGVKVYEIYGKLAPLTPIQTKEYAFMEMTRKL